MSKVMNAGTFQATIAEAQAEIKALDSRLQDSRARVGQIQAQRTGTLAELKESRVSEAMGGQPTTPVQTLKARIDRLTEELEVAEALVVGLERLQGAPRARLEAAQTALLEAKQAFVRAEAKTRIEQMKQCATELQKAQGDLIALVRVAIELGIRHEVASDILHLQFSSIEERRGWPRLGDRHTADEDLRSRMSAIREQIELL